jgi:hypothetical protein
MNDFYVGYVPKAPDSVHRDMRRVIAILSVVALAVGLFLIFGQQPFPAAFFEFQQFRGYEGVVREAPYPTLVTADAHYLLAAPGKHGLTPGLDGKRVQLEGALIHRGSQRMLEVLPGSLRPGSSSVSPQDTIGLGAVRLRGEIVDSKCYLGVMNPGNGKVHRDCAARCISGGLPPALVARDASGSTIMSLLAGSDGRRLNREVLDFVAEPVEISGELVRAGSWLVLMTEPANIRRLY